VYYEGCDADKGAQRVCRRHQENEKVTLTITLSNVSAPNELTEPE